MALRYVFAGDSPNRFEVLTDGMIARNNSNVEVYPDSFHNVEIRDREDVDVINGMDFTILEVTRFELINRATTKGYTLQEFDDMTLKATRHTAPRITNYSPARGGDTTSLTQNIVLTFSENIARATATGPVVRLLNKTTNAVVETFAFNSGAITVSTNTATINPTASLVNTNEYALLISNGYFTDSGATDVHGGIHDPEFYNFTASS